MIALESILGMTCRRVTTDPSVGYWYEVVGAWADASNEVFCALIHVETGATLTWSFLGLQFDR